MTDILIRATWVDVDQTGAGHESSRIYVFNGDVSLSHCIETIHKDYKWMNIALYPNQLKLEIHIPKKEETNG